MGLRTPPRAVVLGLAFGAVALALGTHGCGDDGKRPAGSPPGATLNGVPGIVLLCMDTLRADGLTRTEGEKGPMPALDAFSRGATVFADAASPSSWTAPSVASLLTGLVPEHTGVRGAFTAGALVGSVTTLAERLRDAGFSTAASTAGGWLVPPRGYGQGFEAFSTTFDEAGPEATVAKWGAGREKGKPFFLFLHTLAPHDPYGPKDRASAPADVLPDVAERAKSIFRETKDAGWKLPPGAAAWMFDLFLFHPQARGSVGDALGAESWDRLWALVLEWLDGEGRGSKELAALAEKAKPAYREGLRYADRVFARTLAALHQLSLPDGTVLVVVGDHGEALGEHGTLLHARWLYDELVRVPLVIQAAGRLPAGRFVSVSCGLVDVVPTLLELAGVPVPVGLDGRSLLPLAKGGETGHPVFAEESRRVPGSRDDFLQLFSARTEAAKALLTIDPKTHAVVSEELYDLEKDPGETASLPMSERGRFGEAFCRAVETVRARAPALSKEPSACAPAMK